MTEVEQLERAMQKLSTCDRAWDRPALEKIVLLWGVRTYGQIKTLVDLLDRQLTWLDTHTDHPAYEERFADWLSNLDLYKRSCDAVSQAKALNIGVAIEEAA